MSKNDFKPTTFLVTINLRVISPRIEYTSGTDLKFRAPREQRGSLHKDNFVSYRISNFLKGQRENWRTHFQSLPGMILPAQDKNPAIRIFYTFIAVPLVNRDICILNKLCNFVFSTKSRFKTIWNFCIWSDE